MNIYNIDNGLINNASYDILQYAIEYENDDTISGRDYVRLHPNHMVSSDSESESDSDDNENEDNENETIIEIEENRENAQETQNTNNIVDLTAIDNGNDDDIMLDGNLILPDIHNEIRQHINSAIQLLSANITVRNRQIIEFNNNWGNVYNDNTSNNIGNRIEYGIDNGIVARSPVPFSNNQLEQGEVIETISSYVNSENKNIV
jgi:hypothetical protein